MRFRKSFKLFPGVRINLSGSGLSTSIGPKGATVNIKPGRAPRATVGILGAGISHTEAIRMSESQPKGSSGSLVVLGAVLVVVIVLAVVLKSV